MCTPLPPGRAGEVLIRGYTVMRGYWDDPDAIAEVVDAEGWLHTGDIGVLDDRSLPRVVDRTKDMYIAGGFNVYPAEVENILAAYPAISDIARGLTHHLTRGWPAAHRRHTRMAYRLIM